MQFLFYRRLMPMPSWIGFSALRPWSRGRMERLSCRIWQGRRRTENALEISFDLANTGTKGKAFSAINAQSKPSCMYSRCRYSMLR